LDAHGQQGGFSSQSGYGLLDTIIIAQTLFNNMYLSYRLRRLTWPTYTGL